MVYGFRIFIAESAAFGSDHVDFFKGNVKQEEFCEEFYVVAS